MSDSRGGRPTPQHIYELVKEDAGEELERPPRALGFSGLFAGFTIGATPLAVAGTLYLLDAPRSETFVAALLYPIGFVAVIIGRAQLFTENTLYPVVSSLEDRRQVPKTLRLWAIVLAANLVGGLGFALLAVESSALPSDLIAEFSNLGEKAADKELWPTFWSAVLAGWLLALVAWLVEAAETAIGQRARSCPSPPVDRQQLFEAAGEAEQRGHQVHGAAADQDALGDRGLADQRRADEDPAHREVDQVVEAVEVEAEERLVGIHDPAGEAGDGEADDTDRQVGDRVRT